MTSFFVSLSLSDWMDLLGLLMVLAGVVGEVWSAKKDNKAWEARWGYVLIIGLGFELCALPHHFTEAGELKKIAAESNERSKQLESANLVLRSNVVALETELQWRTITPEQATNFVNKANDLRRSLKVLTTNSVSVDVEDSDVEARWFAKRIVDVLRMGGVNARLDGALSLSDPESSGPFVGAALIANGTHVTNRVWSFSGNAAIVIVGFESAGITNVVGINDTNMAIGEIRIKVGHKPGRW